MKGSCWPPIRVPRICIPKVAHIWAEAVRCLASSSAQGIPPLPALLCCSGLFTHQNGVRAQEEILTLRLRQGVQQSKDGLLAAALPTSAIVNPKRRTEHFCFNRTLRLKARWGSALRRYNRHHRNAKCSFSGLFLEN